jgi:5'-methylthioadenosine phosphorylase
MRHEFPPHRIPYQANLWAMKELGVHRIVAPNACGSLQEHVRPGDFVICDQLVDRTRTRPNTFYDGPVTTHISFADPYCPTMRRVAVEQGRRLSIPLHERGTVVVIEGPRFSTRAESAWFKAAGWEVINMTQYPEAVLARELEICYANVSLITDYDVGVEDVPPVTHEEVVRVFEENNARLRELLFAVIPALPAERDCPCATALAGARFEVS